MGEIRDITPEEIMELDLAMVIEYMEQLNVNPTEDQLKNYLTLRFGDQDGIEFDIYKVLTSKYNEKEKRNIIIIDGNEMHWSDFFTEISRRKAIAKKTLIAAIEDTSDSQAREELED